MIKRAFILAKQKKQFQRIAARTRSMFFLATPHRGADLAELLGKILTVSSGARPFVADLERNSVATQSINEEFPQYCQDLELFSFYETLPTKLGITKKLVVDKDLATLGYANEHTAYLNANHREVCKYATQTDPNYQTVRNALASTIDDFRSGAIACRRKISTERHRLLSGFLGLSEAPEDYLMDVDSKRMSGSCEWQLQNPEYQNWQDSANPQIYWIGAKPATGKTVLSGKIIHHLKDLQRDICFFFFDYRSNATTTIISFLLSMAWQMAQMHPEALNIILEIREMDNQLFKADYRTIWRKLFLDSILRLKFHKPQYWVIDALDECTSHIELVPLLLKVIESGSVRIFLTSRDRFENQRQASHLKDRVISQEIRMDDTKYDIRLYLESHMDELPLIDKEARQDMVHTILAKSNGCFLWVRLILETLRQVHTSAEIRQVLRNVPSDMSELYSRILEHMSMGPHGKNCAKAILTWTVCSARALSTQELYYALQLDMKDNIDNVARTIISSCGQLVYVDAKSHVQMVHQTAQEFLLRSGSDSEFAIDWELGHKRLLLTCLEYLSGNNLKGSRHRRFSVVSSSKQCVPFMAYASTCFFEHVLHVNSTDDEILQALATFLKSWSFLSWIQYIAEEPDLGVLIQTSKALKNFLQRRSRYLSPLGKEAALLDSWATDLERLVTKFGTNLMSSPRSIFHLIPPLCPPASALRTYFASSTRAIAVLGLSETTWDDCMSTIVHAQDCLSAIACSNKHFAIGMSSGKILLYNSVTCQETRGLQQLGSVKILLFAQRRNLLVSTGFREVNLWDTSSWLQLWRVEVAQPCRSIAFTEDEQLLLGALTNNHFMAYDLETGALRKSANWTVDLEVLTTHAGRQPIVAEFCVEQGVLALGFRHHDIILWDFERYELREMYCKFAGVRSISEKARPKVGTMGLVFGSADTAGLLAASYLDGELVLFDTIEGTIIARTEANAHSLACSPDGRTLACGHTSGNIQLFDFRTLKLLYTINSIEFGNMALAFSRDNYHLLTIQRTQCRVWDPHVLVREDADEDNSGIASASTAPQGVTTGNIEDETLIDSMTCFDGHEVCFIGKADGSVYVYENKYCRQSYELCSLTRSGSIQSLFFDKNSRSLVSTHSYGTVTIHRLVQRQERWEIAGIIFDHREGAYVHQVLTNEVFSRLLVCTAEKQTLWSMSSEDGVQVIRSLSWRGHGHSTWITHPTNLDQLILIIDKIAHVYEWQTLERLTSAEGIILDGNILPKFAIHSITSCFNSPVIATTFCEPNRSYTDSQLLMWNASDFNPHSRSAAPVPSSDALADQLKLFIGFIDEHKVVFLSKNGWICSVDLQSANADDFSRHFFLPAGWLSMGRDILCEVMRNGDIIFVKLSEVVIIKNGLNNVEPGRTDVEERSSLLSTRQG